MAFTSSLVCSVMSPQARMSRWSMGDATCTITNSSSTEHDEEMMAYLCVCVLFLFSLFFFYHFFPFFFQLSVPKSKQNFLFSIKILQPNFVLFVRGGADWSKCRLIKRRSFFGLSLLLVVLRATIKVGQGRRRTPNPKATIENIGKYPIVRLLINCLN